jgi:integrase/recombinase XerC
MTVFFQEQHADKIGKEPLQSLIEGYVSFYASGSSHTARAKQLDLNHFLNFLLSFRRKKSPKDLKVSDWDFSSVQRFVEDSLKAGESPATVARRLATLKHMGRMLSEKFSGFINPARDVKAPKIAPAKPKSLEPNEIEQIREAANNSITKNSGFIHKRNLTIFNFLLDTGLRADEIRLLRLNQIDDELTWIKDVRTKGRRFRNVYITSAMREHLIKYLELREKELSKFFKPLTNKTSKQLPLFISTFNAVPDKPDSFLLGAKTLWRSVRQLSTDTKLHPHLLRHSFAIDLLEQSNDIRLVAQALGHSDVRVTMRYTERRDEEVAAALEKSRKNFKKSK